MTFGIPWDNIGRLDLGSRIDPGDERMKRTMSRSSGGGDVGKSGPSGWHC